MQLLEIAKSELIRSNADRKHPFRIATFGTLGEYPEIRTVVKRKVFPNLDILIYTDSRTPKIEEIKNNPNCSLLFYHNKNQLQIRMKGVAEIIDGNHELYIDLLSKIKSSKGIKDYTTSQVPGSPVTDVYSDDFYGNEIYFSGILFHPLELDILQLNSEKHSRWKYIFDNKEWKGTEIIP